MEKKKALFVLLFCLIFVFSHEITAQQTSIAGAPPNAVFSMQNNMQKGVVKTQFMTPTKVAVDSFETTVFTYSDIVIFSYFDNTTIRIYDSGNNLLEEFTLIADTIHRSTVSAGVYHIVGSNSFTVLIGDPITNYVNGYFAVDQAGRAVSTKLNTWMMTTYGYSSDFIVFAYEDNTGFTVKNLETGYLIAAGTLNKGEHYSFAEHQTIPENTPLQVVGTKPVSALSYSDQDYYIPSTNGYFTGNLFYGYSGYVGGWANSITVTSYSDSNYVLITNSVTGDTIDQYMLMNGQVNTYNVYDITFWTVESSGKVSVANIPFGVWSGSYYYLARSIDETGTGAGKLFYVPTCQSDIYVSSFEPDNILKITQLGLYTDYPYPSSTVIYEDTLDLGESYHFFSSYGSNVYQIEGSGNVSVIQTYGGFGADFVPLSFALQLPDLTLSTADIEFSVPDSVYVAGDTLIVTVSVHNVGSIDASNIHCTAYDGDPDLGGVAPPVGSGIIPFIPVGNTGSFDFMYVVPNNPEYRSIVVKIDPNNLITESNKSNNKAQRFLRPNKDLLPPLTVTVTAPSNLSIDSLTNEITPNPFTARYDIFNTGDVTATDVQIELELFNGLTLSLGTNPFPIGNIEAGMQVSLEFIIDANEDSSGFNLYNATITASNAETKIVYRAVNVPDAIPPSSPEDFYANMTGNNNIHTSWTANNENDLAGYYLYYSNDSTNWNGTGADQGDSPIIVYSQTEFDITGLPLINFGDTKYWFKLKAFDTSLNLSEDSDVQTVILTDVEDEKAIPTVYSLSQNYPNPFNPSSKIKYSIPFESNVKLTIFNVIGQVVDVLVNQSQKPGIYEVNWIAKNLSSGVYLYSLDAISLDNQQNFREVKKMILMK